MISLLPLLVLLLPWLGWRASGFSASKQLVLTGHCFRHVSSSSSSPSNRRRKPIFISQATSTSTFNKKLGSDDNHGHHHVEDLILSDLNRRLQVLEASAPQTLGSFFEPALLSFSIQPGTTQQMSITSTCFALQAIMASNNGNNNDDFGDGSSLYKNLITMNVDILKLDAADSRTPVRQILQALLRASSWRPDDLFQVPVLLYTLLRVDKDRKLLGSSTLDEATASRIRQLLEAVLEARPRRREGLDRKYSEYITFQCARVYALLYESTLILPPIAPAFEEDSEKEEDEAPRTTWDPENTASDDVEDSTFTIAGLAANTIPIGTASQLSLALQRCAESSANELYRQLALRTAGDDSDFDVMRLAYSLLTYIVSTNSLAGRTAGRELVRGQGPSKGTKVPPVNPKLVRAALQAFMEEQLKNGLWPQGQPIYRSFRRTGRQVGNAYIFSVDTLCSLLEELPASAFAPYLTQLSKTVEWLETHRKVEILADYCDPETGQCYGRALEGWTSPHLSPEVGPQAWSTAQALACISRLQTIVESLRHTNVLQEFNGVSFAAPAAFAGGATGTSWEQLLDSDLGHVGGDGRHMTLKQVLQERMIDPRTRTSSSTLSGKAVMAPSYSAVLFGPPGTAKTTICEALARRIGWDFVVIDTSVFLADGLGNVASRIQYVFGRLLALRKCIILFDEIEEFCLDRADGAIGMESRMLTTAMLTAINDLRRAKRCIFFMATNRLRALDAAITRPGRFDMQLFVGTPNLEARTIQFLQKLADVPASVDQKQEALASYQSFLASVWDDDAKYMNYLEGVQFASACANLVAQGRPLDQNTMATILKSQVAVMTVRGFVREEFDASMELSRL